MEAEAQVQSCRLCQNPWSARIRSALCAQVRKVLLRNLDLRIFTPLARDCVARVCRIHWVLPSASRAAVVTCRAQAWKEPPS